MARAINKLTPKTVAALSKTGNSATVGDLTCKYPRTDERTGYFVLLYTAGAEMGLGSLNTITLAEARQAAVDCRKQLREGIDPIEQRKATLQVAKLANTKTMTFDECSAAFIEAKQGQWKNPKHRQQWTNTLATLCQPRHWQIVCRQCNTGLVLKILEPLWETKTETASRLRGRIESVLSWATTRK